MLMEILRELRRQLRWATTSSSGSHDFDFNISASSLIIKPKKGDKVGYQLINNATSTYADATNQTTIIESTMEQ